MCGSKPKMPDVPPAPSVPAAINRTGAEEQTAMKNARDAQKKKAAMAGGRSSTILTSAEGDQSAANLQKATLLGGK